MGKIEQKLFDLEEYLRRNDANADRSAYLTIVGIANDVSEIESENAKLRELLHDVLRHYTFKGIPKTCEESARIAQEEFELDVRAHELGVCF